MYSGNGTAPPGAATAAAGAAAKAWAAAAWVPAAAYAAAAATPPTAAAAAAAATAAGIKAGHQTLSGPESWVKALPQQESCPAMSDHQVPDMETSSLSMSLPIDRF